MVATGRRIAPGWIAAGSQASQARAIAIELVDGPRICEELELAHWERLVSATRHVPRVGICYDVQNRVDFRIAGCSCGWQVPDPCQNPDDEIAWHVAGARSITGLESRRMRGEPRVLVPWHADSISSRLGSEIGNEVQNEAIPGEEMATGAGGRDP